MNILTDRCKLEFDDFCTENSIDQTQLQLHKSWYFASVCDYFESLNIIITLSNVCDDWWYQIKCPNFKSLRPDKYSDSKTKYQALENAIIKANDFRNSKLLKKEVGIDSVYILSKTQPTEAADILFDMYSKKKDIYIDRQLNVFNLMTRLSLMVYVFLEFENVPYTSILEILSNTTDMHNSQTRKKLVQQFDKMYPGHIDTELDIMDIIPENYFVREELIFSYEMIMKNTSSDLYFIEYIERPTIDRSKGFSVNEALFLLKEEFVVHPLDNPDMLFNFHDEELGLMSGETMQGDMTSENLKRFSERWEIHVDDKVEL